jgi:hypothetical protein
MMRLRNTANISHRTLLDEFACCMYSNMYLFITYL